ncbi:MAG TPA: TonB-dependent receptor [Parafilimonas sp.]|nr:TonB-dependent receptor [Parafilimonas sp.]
MAVFVFVFIMTNAQTDSLMFAADTATLQGVVISGMIPARANETSWNITRLTQQNMRASGAFNLSDALAKLPGVNQLTTGAGISKPVIRGLYGDRVLAIISGLRFDNQQWQDEHGLGLNDMGIDRVEVIKGPSSLLYGSEAIGGALNIVEEMPAKPHTTVGDLNVQLFSNTLGTFTDLGFKGAGSTQTWSVRAGINSQADYTDGNGDRILNTRFGGYYLKGSYGFKSGNWTSTNHYVGSIDNYGFIMADNMEAKEPDGRWSRSMDGPHHTVCLNILSSDNRISLQNSTLKLNVGGQSNLRMEDEGGGETSLKMLLSSGLYNLQWVKPLSAKTQFVVGNNFLFQNNTNYGKRVIIPDANTVESGASVYVKNSSGKFILEAGTGFSLRNIVTEQTPGVSSQGRGGSETPIQPFSKTYPVLNASTGAVANLNKNTFIKLNIGTGFRSGNLAELSSNGLHEGTFRYEIGDPNLKVEYNINSEAEISFSKNNFSFSLTGFYNHFNNYIYLTSTGEQYLGFEVYRYLQYDANLYGGEASMQVHISGPLKFSSDFSTVKGKLTNGTYLPFIPADKWHNAILVNFRDGKKLKQINCFIGSDICFTQNHPAQFEISTPGYNLLSAGASADLALGGKAITVSVAGNNILNEYYYDHLSRFKGYGIHNIGRNLVLNVRIPFSLN